MQASESWSVIARVMELADSEAKRVVDAYVKAISLGTGRLSPKTVVSEGVGGGCFQV